MKALLIVCAVLAAGTHCYSFAEYVKEFGKSYLSEEEYSYRSTIFADNYKDIVEWNANPDAEYGQKPSMWTDYTIAEISKA